MKPLLCQKCEEPMKLKGIALGRAENLTPEKRKELDFAEEHGMIVIETWHCNCDGYPTDHKFDAQGILRDKDGKEIDEAWIKEHVW